MAYDYSSESKRLELPNPYRLQNLWLWLCAVLMAGGGVLCLWWTRAAMQGASARLAVAPLLTGLLLLVAGLGAAGVAARRLRFFFGRGRPRSLAPELANGTTGGSAQATAAKDMLRQGGLTYPEPQGALNGVLYHWVPRLITAPLAVQDMARRNFFNLAALAATSLSFIVSYALLGNEQTRPWIGVLYFVFGAVFLLRPLVGQHQAPLSMPSVVGLIAAAILAPVAVGLIAPHLPSLGSFTLSGHTAVMLGTGLAATVLMVLAVHAQIGEPPQAQSTGEQMRLSMNAPPSMLLDELDRKLQDEWTEHIPNRRYARLEPAIDPARTAGPFAGELLEETQPMPLAGSEAPTLGSALAAVRHRWLVLIDLYATLLVLVAVLTVLYFVRGFDPQDGLAGSRLSLVGVSTILLLVAAFCFKGAGALWGRFNFESILVWVELAGTYQRAQVGTGNQFSSRLNTETEVLRTEAMTLRVWRARIESVVFGKDAPRQVTAMFSTTAETRALAEHLAEFGRAQSVLVAPASAEDQRRMAALGSGERSMSAAQGAAPAAQLHHDIRALAALQDSAPASDATRTQTGQPQERPSRFCSACGSPLTASARFCPACGTAVAPQG